MDQIFYVNTASFVEVSISSSLVAAGGSNIDFSQATQVSGSFVGSLLGNASTATTASYALTTGTAQSAVSASYATSASIAVQAQTATSASHAVIADTAVSATTATSASYANTSSVALVSLSTTSASYAVSSSVAAVATSASFATTAQTAQTAVTASYYNLFPNIKSGKLSASVFGGNPMTASVTFATPYPNTNYSVTIIGGDARSWTLEQVSASKFTISTNSKFALSDFVYWTAMGNGESV
jgi:hypothetical protein